MDGHGNTSVKLRCSASPSRSCHDAVAIYSPGGTLPARLAGARVRRATLLGIVHATVPAGRTMTVRVHFNRAGRRLIARSRRSTARLLLSSGAATGASANTHVYSVTLARRTRRR